MSFSKANTKRFVRPKKQVNRLSISPDKRILAAAGYNAVRLYDINDRASNNPVSLDP